MRLFCLPYAGGRETVFQNWPELLPDDVEVCTVLLPGRGIRFREPPFTRMAPLVNALMRALLAYVDKPFAFFGHSMGALVSFELARQLRRHYGLLPAQLFVSGCPAPQVPDVRTGRHLLTDSRFVEELRRLNGTPATLLGNSELMQLALPALRSDFAVRETYVYEDAKPLDCPISAFGGLDDTEVRYEHLESWRAQTSLSFSLHLFHGDHFFLHTACKTVLEVLSQELAQKMKLVIAAQNCR